MDPVKIIELKESILEDNDKDAEELRQELKKKKICLLNLMSSPGSGKTTTLLALAKAFENRLSMSVMEADIDSDVDARTLLEAGIPSIQLHTGGMCHLDADMTRQGIRHMISNTIEQVNVNQDHENMNQDTDKAQAENQTPVLQTPELIVLENIGNLVCPAEFDTGTAINMTILSVPEGDDKPAKYPLMYQLADIMAVNKIDTMEIFDFNSEKMETAVHKLNPDMKIFYISAKTGEGIAQLADYLIERVRKWNE